MSQMIACDRCRRHHRASEQRCPFCRSRGAVGRAANVVGGAVTTVILAACYGTVDSGWSDKYYTPTGATGETGVTTTPPDTSDSGTTDSGTRDTGATDTGATDTGAGTTDTGTTDTGTGTPDTGGDSGDTAQPVDADGDGFFVPWDCDDTDPTIHPDYPEQCADRIDNDCDGLTDDDDPECP